MNAENLFESEQFSKLQQLEAQRDQIVGLLDTGEITDPEVIAEYRAALSEVESEIDNVAANKELRDEITASLPKLERVIGQLQRLDDILGRRRPSEWRDHHEQLLTGYRDFLAKYPPQGKIGLRNTRPK